MPASVLGRILSARRVNRPATSRGSSSASTAGGWLARAAVHPYVPAIAICLFVFAGVFSLWRAGQFQFFELKVYDRFLKTHAPSATGVSPVVIVGITEEDLHRLNTYPIPDDLLTDALQNLLHAQPAAVVVDLFRDLPVPGKDPSGRDRLAALFAKNPNLIAIQRLGLGNEPAVRPPPFLSDLPEQVGFNDFSILDQKIDDTVRRATLMMWENGVVYYSDPLLATFHYLQAHDIAYKMDESDSRDLRLGEAAVHLFESNDGAYVHAGAQGYQILLGFRGPAKFQTFEFADALSGQIAPDAIRGKVVVLGPLAVSLKDFVSTPLATRFPGMLLHAHIVHQLIQSALHGERPLRFWHEWQEAFWLLAWCMVGTVVGSKARSPVVFASVFIVSLLALAGVYWFAMLADLWLLVVAPALGFACTSVLSTSHQAYLERRQRDVLMQLFAQHVSANIAADIWNHRDQFMDGHRPKSQVIPGTVFFTDLKGFTSTAESLPPEVLLDWLNEYMEVMAALIEQHGGMVNKYMGDAIMAVFGAPIPRTDDEAIRRDATSAVRCALAMGRELDRLNAEWEKRGMPTTMMRVGIASGALVSGSIGGSRRLEYTVTGDTVVIAKRLESAEKESTHLEKASNSCRILMTDKTFSMLAPHFKARQIGPMQLEGKHHTVGVYVLIGEDGKEPA